MAVGLMHKTATDGLQNTQGKTDSSCHRRWLVTKDAALTDRGSLAPEASVQLRRKPAGGASPGANSSQGLL